MGSKEKLFLRNNLKKIKLKEMSNLSFSESDDSECSLHQKLKEQGHRVETRDRLSNTVSYILDNRSKLSD